MQNEFAAAFDELAADYDRQFNSLPSVQGLRKVVWEEITRRLSPGQCVLDLGCGTGEDAVFLAQQGIKVWATDISEEMIRVARSKPESRHSGVRFFVADAALLADTLPEMLESCEERKIDAVLSNFGSLNCLDSLGSIRLLAGRHLKAGGHLFFCLINRYYLRELCKGIFRRLRKNGSLVRCGRRHIPVYYHSPGRLCWPGYSKLALYGLAVFGRGDVHRHEPLNRLGDHYFLVLRKECG